MHEKLVSAECEQCESSFELTFQEELVSQDVPCFCPFCGERIEDIKEEYIEDDTDIDDFYDENEEWK